MVICMITQNVMKKFEEYCSKSGIDGKEKEEKLKKLEEAFQRYLYEPGEAIGVIAAQSISEPATQMTMRSYTMASQSDRLSKVTHGLPRLIEIFDARKTFEKNMIIYLKPEYNTKEKAKEPAMKIKSLKMSDIIVYDSIDLVNLQIEVELEKESYKAGAKELLDKHAKDCEVTMRGKNIYIKPKKENVKNLRKLKNKLLKLHTEGIKG